MAARLAAIDHQRMTERVRQILRQQRLQEPESAPRIFDEMSFSVAEQAFAYLAGLKVVNSLAYERICDEYSEVIARLRRGELDGPQGDSSLDYFARQLVSELVWAIVASEHDY